MKNLLDYIITTNMVVKLHITIDTYKLMCGLSETVAWFDYVFGERLKIFCWDYNGEVVNLRENVFVESWRKKLVKIIERCWFRCCQHNGRSYLCEEHESFLRVRVKLKFICY